MAILISYFLPHYTSHSKCQFSLPQRRRSGWAISRAIRSPKCQSNPQKLDEDDFWNGNNKIKWKKRRKGRDGSSNKRRWWSDEYEAEQESSEVKFGILEQLVDNLLIFQVLKSYGWFSPIVIFSLLLATGLKAFLMAFAIPFGLSLVIFAFQKLQEWPVGSPKPRYRRKRRAKFGGRLNAVLDEEDDQEESQQGKRNKRKDYQSQFVQNNGSFKKSDSASRINVNNFGGWDDLVGEYETKRAQRPSPETGRLKTMMEKERLSRLMKERDLP